MYTYKNKIKLEEKTELHQVYTDNYSLKFGFIWLYNSKIPASCDVYIVAPVSEDATNMQSSHHFNMLG